MKIIAFLNPKGGSGKTTAIINVSSCLASSDKKIAVVDTDPQMSLTNWNKEKKPHLMFTPQHQRKMFIR